MNNNIINDTKILKLNRQIDKDKVSIEDNVTSSSTILELCILENDNDKQCGNVFLNEVTRVLKFQCYYCHNIYDNIHYFCDHLTDHLNEDELSICLQQPVVKSSAERGFMHDCYGVQEHNDTHDMIVEEMLDEQLDVASEIADEMETISEEMDDVDDDNGDIYGANALTAEVDAKDFGAEDEDFDVYDENSEMFASSANESKENNQMRRTITPTPIFTSTSTNVKTVMKPLNGNVLLADPIDVIGNNCYVQGKLLNPASMLIPKKKKKKKVTRVKVINVRNRVSDLYNLIKAEEQKRLRPREEQAEEYATRMAAEVAPGCEDDESNEAAIFLTSGKNNDDMNNDDDMYDDEDSDETKDTHSKPNIDRIEDQYFSQKDSPTQPNISNQQHLQSVQKIIIGETVITLFPEGTDTNTTKIAATAANNATVTNQSMPSSMICTTGSLQPGRYHRNTNAKDCICPACGKQFRSSFSLSIHKRTHYLESKSDIKLAHKCADCDQLFNKITELREHVVEAHFPDGFICKICNKELSSMTMLETHMRKVHLNRPITCVHCKKNFANRYEYEEHVNSPNGCIYNFRCRICGRKYTTEMSLNQHVKNHKEPVPQCCVVCGKVTLRLTQHMKIHAPRPKQLLACNECGKEFNFRSGLSTHKRHVHGNQARSALVPRNTNAIYNNKRVIYGDNQRSTNQSINYAFNTNLPSDSDNYAEVQDNSHLNDSLISEKSSSSFSASTSASANTIADKVATSNNQNEEEDKRVIVEMIQNAKYKSYLSENDPLEGIPPIAREETISAVSSIVNDC